MIYLNVLLTAFIFRCSRGHLDDNAFQPNSPFNEMHFQSNHQATQCSGDGCSDAILTPILIWWTNGLFPHFKEEQFTQINCDGYTCLSTQQRQFLNDERTRGIIFYGSDISPNTLPLPRKPYHEWALFHEESPMNNYLLSTESFISLFNHTATFRSESDYPVTTQNIYSLKFLTDRKPIPLDIKNAEKEKRDLASVLYVQSHSGVPSDRDSYVEELMKYIKIDSYGTCLHNRDLPDHLTDPAESFEKDEFLDFISKYKFHLAFENAVCKDYMTEKLMRPLHVGSVPIYYGSPTAQEWMPNNSTIIMVKDFESPQKLADYINFLDNNDEEYEKFMQFKKPGGVTNEKLVKYMDKRPWGSHDHNFYIFNIDNRPDYFQGFECHICKNIHKRMEAEKLELPLPPKMANNSHLGCPEPFSSLGLDTEELKDRWTETDWTMVYRGQETMAKAVRDMIDANETKPENFINYLNRYIKRKSL